MVDPRIGLVALQAVADAGHERDAALGGAGPGAGVHRARLAAPAGAVAVGADPPPGQAPVPPPALGPVDGRAVDWQAVAVAGVCRFGPVAGHRHHLRPLRRDLDPGAVGQLHRRVHFLNSWFVVSFSFASTYILTRSGSEVKASGEEFWKFPPRYFSLNSRSSSPEA